MSLKLGTRKHRDYLWTSASLFAISEAMKARAVWGVGGDMQISYENVLFRRAANGTQH